MNGLSLEFSSSKPFPSPPSDGSLPPLPPGSAHSFSSSLPQSPPHQEPASIKHSQSLSPNPDHPAPTDGKLKKANPLVDLIETERAYVERLAGVIRKVAGAWSRSNLPPPELDTMFRSIEGVYKANRGLNNKLKEIGTNPSSPKALGDLLMRWIDDLDTPYTAYCKQFCTGFDTWEPVQSNPKLASILATFSETNPPTSGPDVWSLDALFLLPKARLKYYKKLYGRLLKNTAPGKSDYPLLVRALETLDRLLGTLDVRTGVHVSSTAPQDEVVVDLRQELVFPDEVPPTHVERTNSPSSEPQSTRDSEDSNRELANLVESALTTPNRGSASTMSSPIVDLERRLSTQRTLDIFTMNPKTVKLQMSPPQLTFTRELRFSIDVIVRFTPRAIEREVVHTRGHIFLLSDLFLLCERMTPEERAQQPSNGPDMWLCYPPLAGKVLRVCPIEGRDNCLQIAVMRKEHLTIEVDSSQTRDFMLRELKECIEFAGSLPPVSKQPPPPMPPLPSFNQQGPTNQRKGGISSQQPSGASTPLSSDVLADNRIADSMSRLALSPEVQMQQGAQRMPLMHNMQPPPGPMAPQHPVGFGSGQMFPPSTPTRSSFSSNRSEPGPPYLPGPNPPQGPGPMGMSPGPIPPRGPVLVSMGSGGPGSISAAMMVPGSLGVGYGPGFSSPGPPKASYNLSPGPSGLGNVPPRPPSEPSLQNGMRKIPSSRSLASQFDQNGPLLPPPPIPGYAPYPPSRNGSLTNLHVPQPRTVLPSAQYNVPRAVSMAAEPMFDEPSPPNSPVAESRQHLGPVTSTISAQMKCKVFLQQQHAQWKSLGAAKLKLYRQDPTNIKQLVVEAENKDKTVLISTIVLTDGVERVGKTGVAIELSDNGARTGIIYMLQLRNETSAGGLFESLLVGSDRAGKA